MNAVKFKNVISVLSLVLTLAEGTAYAECSTTPLYDKNGIYRSCHIEDERGERVENIPFDQCEAYCHKPENSSIQSSKDFSSFRIVGTPELLLRENTVVNNLIIGNTRFETGTSIHPHVDPLTRQELGKGQKPSAVIVACSDSRVSPEIIFDQGLGDIFVVRTAGHTMSDETRGSIEFAIEHLGSRLLVVLGHESCGAVKAALAIPKGSSAGSQYIDHMLNQIRPNISSYLDGSLPHCATTLEEPVKENTVRTAEQLMRDSKIIRDAIISRKVKIVTGYESIQTWKVEFFGTTEEI